jgi:Zn-finger nucleic acid-binding protein
MAYLNCPTCRLTVYSPTVSAISDECPRCRAKLGKVSRLFRSQLPPRLVDAAKVGSRDTHSGEAVVG